MSFLSIIENFIKKDVLGIENNNTRVQNADKKSKPGAIITYETDAPEDKVIINKDNNDKPAPQAQVMSHKALEQSIENIPSEHFNIRKMLRNGLIEKITGVSKEDFENLTQSQKNLIRSSLHASVAKFEKMMADGTINKNANPEELVLAFAEVLYSAINSGAFENVEEFQNEMNDITEKLGPDFNKKPADVQRTELKASRVNNDKILQKRLEEIDNDSSLSPEKKEYQKNMVISKHRELRKGQFIDISAQYDSKTAANAIIILNSDDIEYGLQTLLDTRCDDAEKMETADYTNYDFTTNLLKDYKEIGDDVKPEVLQAYTQTNMTYKSADAANEYQEAYIADRDKFEAALEKQRRGEALTAEEQELLALMSPDYYTATAQGIGQGALNNVNMTADEKSAFIAKWDNDAKKYSDYEIVTQNVKNEIENNPEYKEIKTKIKEIQQNADKQKSEKQATTTPTTTATNTTTPKLNTVNIPDMNDKKVVSDGDKSKSKEEPKNNTSVSSVPSSKKIDKSMVKAEINERGLNETIEEYGSDAVAVILDDPDLKRLRPQLTPIIKSYDLTTLKELTQECSGEAFVYICGIVNDDYIEKLQKNREHTKALSYDFGRKVENLKGEYAAA